MGLYSEGIAGSFHWHKEGKKQTAAGFHCRGSKRERRFPRGQISNHISESILGFDKLLIDQRSKHWNASSTHFGYCLPCCMLSRYRT